MKSAQIKVNCINESVYTAESARADVDRLDPTVNAFCGAITDLQNSGFDDLPQVILDGFGGLFDRFGSHNAIDFWSFP